MYISMKIYCPSEHAVWDRGKRKKTRRCVVVVQVVMQPWGLKEAVIAKYVDGEPKSNAVIRRYRF